MKITELLIAPRSSWQQQGPDNPLICKIKLSSENSSFETELTGETCEAILDLVATRCAEDAKANVEAFVEHTRAIDNGSTAMIEADDFNSDITD